MSNFLKQAYHHGRQHALAEFGLLGMTKTARPYRAGELEKLRQGTADFLNSIGRAGGATLAGAGVGALADDDSALEGALLGGLGGLGLNALGARARRAAANKVTDMGDPTIYGALGLGGLGGLGTVGVSNMIDDDDESVLARLGLR